MKKTVKIIIISFMVISLTLISNTAMASFAEWDDKAADQRRNEEIKEQEDKENSGKSSNNFLKSLSIDGMELTPEFDKQTVDYKITKEVDADEIEVKAEAEDTRATVNGIGIIKLQVGENTINIEVVAENKIARTYKIKLTKSGTDTSIGENQEVNDIEEKDPMTFNTTKNNTNSGTSEERNNMKTYIAIACILIILIMLYVFTTSKKGKGKHK